MTSILDFLSNGKPVPAQPTSSDVNTSYPLWLQQYDYNIANSANNLATTPYTQFPGQQVATPSAATQQGQTMALGNVGNYQGALNQANQLTANAGTPVSAANINAYMSPYTQNVVGALQQAANNNLFQNQLPQIQDRFVSAGQTRSPQEMQATNNLVYQSNQALDQATAGALQQGYQGALTEANSQQQAQLQAGSQFNTLANSTQGLGLNDVGAVSAVGSQQDTNNQSNINAAMNNFYAQQQWPFQTLGFASNVMRGQNIPTNTQTVGYQANPQATYSASPLQAFTQAVGGSSALGLKKGGHVKKAASRGALNRRAA